MNQFYLVFFFIALILFAGIALYSWMQQRNTPRRSRREYVDPLFAELEKNRIEPVRPEPEPEISKVDMNWSEAAISAPAQKDVANTLVMELVARIKNQCPLEQQELLSLFREHDYKFHRRVDIYGLNEMTDEWRDIEYELPSSRFLELGLAIQLADRDGAMSSKELHDFQQMTLEFSEKFDAPFEFSMKVDDALLQAKALDEIGQRYSLRAVLRITSRSRSGFRMADVESCARDLLMSSDKPGVYMKNKGQKNNMSTLYYLTCKGGSGQSNAQTDSVAVVGDLLIYMNVPATEQPDQVFSEMVKDANSLATWLDGKVLDPVGKALSERTYQKIMQRISDVDHNMRQHGLQPGDTVSKRLF